MSKLKEFAEFLLEVSKVGVYDRREDESEDWVTFTCDVDRHYDTYLVYNEFNSGDLRLKPKEEEKKKIPLSIEDITPNTVFSAYNNKGWFKIYSANKYGVESPVQDKYGALSYYSYEDLMEYYYSEDGKTWKECYKYED